MSLKGIDISHYNGWPFNAVTEKAYKESDFAIVKATQWMSAYKWESYYRPAMDRARKDGKLLAAYHYATGLTAKKEAEYFYSVIKPDLDKGDIIPAIEWEFSVEIDNMGENLLQCVLCTGRDLSDVIYRIDRMRGLRECCGAGAAVVRGIPGLQEQLGRAGISEPIQHRRLEVLDDLAVHKLRREGGP